jgi:hypothetical protein
MLFTNREKCNKIILWISFRMKSSKYGGIGLMIFTDQQGWSHEIIDLGGACRPFSAVFYLHVSGKEFL